MDRRHDASPETCRYAGAAMLAMVIAIFISFVVPTFLMHQITGTKRDTVPYHRHIQDGIEAERVDQLIVQKKFPNVVCIVTNVTILADQ